MFDDITWQALTVALDGLSLRQRATANNIANVDTPGYKAQQVTFEGQLLRALNRGAEPELRLAVTNLSHMGGGSRPSTPAITVEQGGVVRNDGNNVDIDAEMASLAETALRYQALTQLASMKIGLLKSIVRER